MEAKQLSELKKLLKVLQDAGVTEYKTAELELKLETRAPQVLESNAEQLQDVAVPFEELSIEDQLLYSAVQQQDQSTDS